MLTIQDLGRAAAKRSIRVTAVIFCTLCGLVFSGAAHAQTITNVTGTVTDPNGIPYSNARMTVTLSIPGATVQVTNQQTCQSGGFGSQPCYIPISTTIGPLTLDATGSFALAIYSNSGIYTLQGGVVTTQWNFAITISPGVLPPWGTGPQSFSVPITVSGASQSVSATLSAAAPALTQTTYPGPGGGVIPAVKYGVKGGAITYPDASWANASSTITVGNSTGYNETPFTSTMVGWFVWGNDWNVNNGVAVHTSPLIPLGTISAVNSATSITVSTTSTAACTSTGPNPNCMIVIGQYDDSNALIAAWHATISAPCGTLVLPATNMLISKPILGLGNNYCYSGGNINNFVSTSGAGVLGQGPDQTALLVMPSFNASANGCDNTSSDHGCFFTNEGLNGEAGMIYQGFTIFGLGVSFSNSTTDWMILTGDRSVMRDVGCLGMLGFLDSYTFQPNSLLAVGDHLKVSQCSTVLAGYDSAVTNSSFLGNTGTTTAVAASGAGGVPAFLSDDSFTSGGSSTAGFSVGSGSSAYLNNVAFNGGGAPYASIDVSGTLHAENLHFGLGNESVCLKVESGGSLFASHVHYISLACDTTYGGTALDVVSGGRFVDLGGNEFANTANSFSIAGSLFGSASITGTAQTAANWSTPAGTGAGQWGTAPSVATCSGSSLREQCTITVGSGTVGSNPVVTITWPVPFVVAPLCEAKQVGGTATLAQFTNGTISATSGAFTYNGTPGASSTIILTVACSNG